MSDITINEQVYTDYQGADTAFELRFYASEPWTDAAGLAHQAGEPGSRTFYKSVACSLASGAITVPQITAPATTDALENPNVRVTVVLCAGASAKEIARLLDGGFFPHTLDQPWTWAALRAASGGALRAPWRPGYLDANETITLFQNLLADFEVAITSFANLSDVDVSGIADGQAPVWSQADGKFIPGDVGGAAPDLSGYATKTGAETLQNKILSGADNTFSNIPQSAVTGVENAIAGVANAVDDLASATSDALDLKAPVNDANLTGNPTAPTQGAGNNTTRLATTAFVQGEIASKAPLASPALTGNPTAPTQTTGNNSTRLATTAFVQQEIAANPGGGASQVGDLSDVDLTGITNGQTLVYSGGQFVPGSTGGAVNVTGFALENASPLETFDLNSPTLVLDMARLLASLVNKLQANLLPNQPTAESINPDSPTAMTFNWEAPVGGSVPVGYVVEIDENSGFASPTTVTLGNVLTYQFTGLAPATQYYCRVAALDALGNQGEWSFSLTDTTIDAPPSPATIPSIWAMYESHTFDHLADGDAIAEDWTDQSGNGRHATVGRSPFLKKNGLGSHSSLLLDGVGGNRGFVLPSMAALTEGHIFIILKKTGAVGSSENCPFAMGTSGNVSLYAWGGDTQAHIDFGSTERNFAPISSPMIDTFRVMDIGSAANDWELSMEGVLQGSTAVNTVSFPASPKLGYFNDGNFFIGEIVACYIFDEKLSDPDRTVVLDWIDYLYGL
ncbi:MAG TPA: fibronectin type III domain-containing protein [Pyrinomonadaceae bacterium]|jgi:hypothetical protein